MQAPLTLAAIAAALVAAAPVRASAPAGDCDGIADGATSADPVRPLQRATCDYDAAELHRRILTLFRRPGVLTVEQIERLFGLPLLRTSYDDPHDARYDLVMAAGPVRGGWEIMLNFSEIFPGGRRSPARFRGTWRPVAIDPRRRGELRLDITWLRPADIQLGSPHCLSVERLAHEARSRGWLGEFRSESVYDAPAHLVLDLERGRERATTDVTGEAGCANDLQFFRGRDGG